MAFGQDFLKAFFGNDYVRDYTHASKVFRTNGYENAPRFKFLFHVYFNLNTSQIPQLRNIFSTPDTSTIGLLVKSIDLPKYKLDTEVLNQYNRKRVIQKKIDYDPINVKFHDDGGDLIRTMWYNYYSYYYKDANQQYRGQTATNGSIGASATLSNGFDYNGRDIYNNTRAVNDWGYVGESYTDGTNISGGKPPFFRDISIYGFNQHKFVEYVLINPLISQWSHDTYDYSQDNGVMENSMTVNYETVKYYTGAIGASRPDTNVQGFADPTYYDQQTSPLSRPGGTRSVLGQGGLLDAGLGIYSDLQSGSVAGVIGAVQKAGTAYNTFKNVKLNQVAKEEVIGAVQGVLRGDVRGTTGSGVLGSIIPASILTSNIRQTGPSFPTPARTRTESVPTYQSPNSGTP
jgi:hypothetical protein